MATVLDTLLVRLVRKSDLKQLDAVGEAHRRPEAAHASREQRGGGQQRRVGHRSRASALRRNAACLVQVVAGAAGVGRRTGQQRSAATLVGCCPSREKQQFRCVRLEQATCEALDRNPGGGLAPAPVRATRRIRERRLSAVRGATLDLHRQRDGGEPRRRKLIQARRDLEGANVPRCGKYVYRELTVRGRWTLCRCPVRRRLAAPPAVLPRPLRIPGTTARARLRACRRPYGLRYRASARTSRRAWWAGGVEEPAWRFALHKLGQPVAASVRVVVRPLPPVNTTTPRIIVSFPASMTHSTWSGRNLTNTEPSFGNLQAPHGSRAGARRRATRQRSRPIAWARLDRHRHNPRAERRAPSRRPPDGRQKHRANVHGSHRVELAAVSPSTVASQRPIAPDMARLPALLTVFRRAPVTPLRMPHPRERPSPHGAAVRQRWRVSARGAGGATSETSRGTADQRRLVAHVRQAHAEPRWSRALRAAMEIAAQLASRKSSVARGDPAPVQGVIGSADGCDDRGGPAPWTRPRVDPARELTTFGQREIVGTQQPRFWRDGRLAGVWRRAKS